MNSTKPVPARRQSEPITADSSHRTVRPLKIQPIFIAQSKWRCLTHSDLTYINKYKPKFLSTIELKSLLRFGELKSVRTLCKALTDTKTISCLIITDPNSSIQKFAQFNHLLKTTNNWKKLILQFGSSLDKQHGSYSSSHTKLKSLVSLRRFTDLSSLSLVFSCSSQTANKLLKSLSRQLRRLSNLESLKIDVSLCYSNSVNDENNDLHSSILQFKYPRSLKFLRLNFQQTASLNAELLPTFTSNIQRCHLLENIDLNLKNIYSHIEVPEAKIWTSLAEKTPCLKTLKLKKTLLHKHEFEKNEIYLDSFQYLKTLENLDIDFYFFLSQERNQILAPLFFTHLASLTNLQSLNLTFSCLKNHPEFLNLLTFPFSSRLKQLRLDFMHFANLDNQSLEDFTQKITSLPSLQSFEFILPKSSSITSEGIIAISSTFKQLLQLKNLRLDFNTISINHKTLEILFKNIAHLNLTSLIIIQNDELEKPKSFFEKLSILFEPGKSLIPCFSALFSLRSLQILSLNLSGFDICTKEFIQFSLALQKLTQMKSLSLEMPQFGPDDNFEGLTNFLSSLKMLQRLRSLNLSFKRTKLCNKEIQLIALTLKDFNREIEDLELYFEHSEKLGNEALGYLGVGLQSLSSLKNLSVVIGKQKAFKKEAVIDLLERILTLNGLESIILNLECSAPYWEMKRILMQTRDYQNLKRLTKFIFWNYEWI